MSDETAGAPDIGEIRTKVHGRRPAAVAAEVREEVDQVADVLLLANERLDSSKDLSSVRGDRSGKYHHLRLGSDLPQPSDDLVTGEVGEPEIQDDNIWLMFRGRGHCCGAVSRFRDDVEAASKAERLTHDRAQLGYVVDQQDRYRHRPRNYLLGAH